MKLPLLSLALAAILSLAPGAAVLAQAAATDLLHEAEVPVADRSEPARAAAERAALTAVLVKLTGRGTANADEILTGPTATVPGLVEQFQYRASDTPGAYRLRVRFDPAAVESLMSVAGVRAWPRTRPLTVVLLGVDELGARRVLGAADPGPLAPALRAAAQARGLPAALPLMDLRDQSALNAADVWGSFVDRIRDAGARYRAEAIVFGRAEREASGQWNAEWSLLLGAERADWRAEGLDPDALAGRIIGDVVERMAATFVTEAPARSPSPPAGGSTSASDGLSLEPIPSRGTGFELVVSGVEQPGDYGVVMGYLANLDLVDRVDVLGVSRGRLTLSLDSGADEGALRRLLEFGRTLSLEGEGVRPEYRLSR